MTKPTPRTDAAREPSYPPRLAKLITDVLSPAVLVAVLLLVVSWRANSSLGQALLQGTVAAAAASLIPIAYILRGVHRGRLADWHITVRAQRKIPLTVCLISTLGGVLALYLLDAPRLLLALITVMAVALAVTWPITLVAKWKVSVHALVAAGVVGTAVTMFGAWGLVTIPVALAVCWSRVALGDHSGGQVLAGFTIGASATFVLLPAIAGSW